MPHAPDLWHQLWQTLPEAQLSGRLEIASGWTEPYRLDYLD